MQHLFLLKHRVITVCCLLSNNRIRTRQGHLPSSFKAHVSAALKQWNSTISGIGIALNNSHVYTLPYTGTHTAIYNDKDVYKRQIFTRPQRKFLYDKQELVFSHASPRYVRFVQTVTEKPMHNFVCIGRLFVRLHIDQQTMGTLQ